jgi:hypothetical protein
MTDIDFKSMSIENLKIMEIAISSYLQGVIDTRKLVEEIFEHTCNLYVEKLNMIEQLIKGKS